VITPSCDLSSLGDHVADRASPLAEIVPTCATFRRFGDLPGALDEFASRRWRLALSMPSLQFHRVSWPAPRPSHLWRTIACRSTDRVVRGAVTVKVALVFTLRPLAHHLGAHFSRPCPESSIPCDGHAVLVIPGAPEPTCQNRRCAPWGQGTFTSRIGQDSTRPRSHVLACVAPDPTSLAGQVICPRF